MELLKDLRLPPLSPHIPSAPGKKRRKKAKRGRPKIKLVLLSMFLFLLLLFLLLGVLPLALLYPSARSLNSAVGVLKGAIGDRDLAAIGSAVVAAAEDFDQLEGNYRRLAYFRLVPVVRHYYEDGVHLLAAGRLLLDSIGMVGEAIRPYEEILGWKVGFGQQITVEQQLGNLVDTLPNLADGLDAVWKNIGQIQNELDQVNPQRYPEEVRGVKVRFWLEEARNILAETAPLVSRGREVLEVAPALLGSPKRTYLVLFQNGAELRATGGFITGFSLLTVEGGRVLDNQFHSGAYFAEHYSPELGSPPRPLGKYLGVGKWHFQDANYWPDFPTTAEGILAVWRKSGLPKVAGVVAINTEIAADLLDLTGPIRIRGYDLDLANINLPEDCRKGGRDFTAENLICRLEYYVEKAPRGGKGTEARKAILGLISDAIIKKVSHSSAEIWPKLVDFVFKHLAEKNLLVYAATPREQDLLRSLGYTGELKEYAGDYLHISDSNFGGLKTNLYLQMEVRQSLERGKEGIWRKTVRIKYYNPAPYDGWLSGYYKDFVRIYVPLGSRLVSVDGALQIWTRKDSWAVTVQNPAGWEENGKTVFGAYFTVAPQREQVLTFVYDLPAGVVSEDEDDASGVLASRGKYRLLLQKQPGTNIGLVVVKIGDTMESFGLGTDREVVISLRE